MTLRRLVHCRSTTSGRCGARRRRSGSTPTPTSIRRRQCSPAPTSPAPRPQNLTDARRALGLLTGRVSADQRHLSSERGDEPVRVPRLAHRAGPPERARPVRAGLLALHADADRELRPALGAAAADAAAQRFVLDVRRSPICAAAPASDRARAGARATSFSLGRLTGITPQYVQYDSGNPGYETDWNNFAPNVGAAWRPERAGRLAARAARRSGSGDDPRPATRSRSLASGWTGSPASIAPTPAPPSTPTAPATRATSSSRARAGRSPSASRIVSGRPRSRIARVSAHAVARQRRRHQIFDPLIKVPQHAFVELGLQRAISKRHGHRRALRRHAAR